MIWRDVAWRALAVMLFIVLLLLPMDIVAAPFFWTWVFATRSGRAWRAERRAESDFPAARIVGRIAGANP